MEDVKMIGHQFKSGDKKYRRMTRTTEEAIAVLSQRYDEQCLLFPRMRQDISKEQYLKANTKAAHVYYQEIKN